MASEAVTNNGTKKVSRHLALLRPENLPPGAYPPIVLAPMVGQSELAFRMQCRMRSNARLCFTPMLNAKVFLQSLKYREEAFSTCEEDRPLIAQFCGNEPETLLKAAKLVEDQVDGIDLNLGCPQNIARRGRYGSFMLEHTDLIEKIISTLASNLKVPVSVKIRLVPGPVENTIELCKRLEKAGCEMITVHGRYREQNKDRVGECNWDAIRRVKEALSIPVVANGGIGGVADMERCIKETGVDAVMSCEAILENPALFGPNPTPDPYELAYEYLDLAKKYSAGQPKPAKGHLFKFLATTLARHPEFYPRLGKSRSLEVMLDIVKELQEMHTSGKCKIENCATIKDGPWYYRYRGVHDLVLRSGDGYSDDVGPDKSAKRAHVQDSDQAEKRVRTDSCDGDACKHSEERASSSHNEPEKAATAKMVA